MRYFFLIRQSVNNAKQARAETSQFILKLRNLSGAASFASSNRQKWSRRAHNNQERMIILSCNNIFFSFQSKRRIYVAFVCLFAKMYSFQVLTREFGER